MLYSFSHLAGFAIRARDGELGTVHDVFFDEHSTRLRYLVVDTGRWLPGRQVLLAPAAIEGVEANEEVLVVGLTQEQVKDSPGIESDRPVSRQEELRIHQHYGWNPYWMYDADATMAAPLWGGLYAPPIGAERELAADQEAAERERASSDPNLRSAREVRGYRATASDGDVGDVDDFLISERAWAIAYLVVDTGSWLSSRPVLVRPDWLRGIDWADRKVAVELDRKRIRTSPPYDRSMTVDDDYERRLAEHYGWSAQS